MKKLLYCLCLVIPLSLFGCSNEKIDETNAFSKYSEKMNALSSYKLEAVMEVKKGENTTSFDVSVCYKNPNNYLAKLVSKENNNVQIILKNGNGVFVLSPALNKSFKFKSEWPLNTFHAYLPESSMKEISNDKDFITTFDDNEIVFESKVSNKTNPKMVSQKLSINRDKLIPICVVVYNSSLGVECKVTFKSFLENISLDSDLFDEEKALKTALLEMGEAPITKEIPKPSSTILDETLKSEVATEVSLLQLYSGKINYTVYIRVLESSPVSYVGRTYDDVVMLNDTVGLTTTNSLSWSKGSLMFSIYSDELSLEEMIIVANSIA